MKNIKKVIALLLILSLAFAFSIGAVYADGPRGRGNGNSAIGKGDCDQDRLQKRDGSCEDCLCDGICDNSMVRFGISKSEALQTIKVFNLDNEILKAIINCDSEEELWPLMEQIRQHVRATEQLKNLDQQLLLQYKEQLKLILDKLLVWKFQEQEQNRIRMILNWWIE